MARHSLIVFLLLLCGSLRGQDARLLHLNGFDELNAQVHGDTLGSNIHLGVSPLLASPLPAHFIPDYLSAANAGSWDLKPMLTAQGFAGTSTNSTIGGGTYVRHHQNKLAFELNYQYLSSDEVFNNRYVDSYGIYPGLWYGESKGSRVQGHEVMTYLSYAPIDEFQIQAGIGETHFGNGYRSHFLSDGGAPYPYVRLNTTVWKLQLTNLFAQFRDFDPSEGRDGTKYGAFHYLSLNAGRRWSFSAFEGVIWEQRDSLYNRGFELNYLNPIIFYRPVEFSLGSPDNVMLGGEVNFRVSNHVKLYSQVMLDEFLLREMIGGSGWWGNKFALQLGAKWMQPFGMDDAFLRFEYNLSRPFTYSHNNSSQSLIHANQALAHPSGANLQEVLLNGLAKVEGYRFELTAFYRMQGLDSDSITYGGDPRSSYNDRDSDYGHFIGQGVPANTFLARLDAYRPIARLRPLSLRASVQYTVSSIDGVSSGEMFLGLGISSLISRSAPQF